jgi:DNA mismatch endonuclease (patch repair protein)
MAAVHGGGNQATELRLISIFRNRGIRGWRRNYSLFGRPDFVFSGARVALFVDGCFWHRCPLHGSTPATNMEFWSKKLQRNVRRDRKVRKVLQNKGWRVVRIWQHELRQPEKVTRKVIRSLSMSQEPG